MKYRVLFIIALFASVLFSCHTAQQETSSDAIVPGEEYIVTASCGDPATKAVRNAAGKVFWEPGDEIGLFYGHSGGEYAMKFTAMVDAPQTTAQFAGALSESAANHWDTEDHIAVYPFVEGSHIYRYYVNDPSDIRYRFTCPLSNVQEGVPGSFDKKAFYAMAVSQSDEFTFKPLLSGFGFSVQSEGVVKATLRNNNGSNNQSTYLLHSEMDFYADTEGNVGLYGYGGERYTSLDLVPQGGSFQPGAMYYFVCAPTSDSYYHNKGLILVLEKEDGSTLTRNITTPVKLKRATFATVAEADKNGTWISAVPAIDQKTFNVSKFGAAITFNVTAGELYDVECNADWLINRSAVGDPVTESCAHTFIVSRNMTDAARSATITLSNSHGSATVTVNQEAGEVWPDYPNITRRHCIISFGSGVAAGPMSHCNLIRNAKTHFGDEVEYFNMFLQNNYFSVPTLKERNQYHWESSSSAAVLDGRRWITIGPSSQADEVRFKDIYDYKEETDALYPPMTSIGLSSDIAGYVITVNMDVYAYQEGNYRFVVYLTRNRINMGAYMAGSFYNVACEKITEDDEDVWPYYVPGTVRHLVKGNNHLQFTTEVTGYNQPLNPANYSIFAYVLAPYGDQPVVRDKGQSYQSGDFEGSYYIDNCRLVQAGESVEAEVVQ